MELLPNKELSLEYVNMLLHRYILYSGGEAAICESDKSYTVYKIFNKLGVPTNMSSNKEKKINHLYNNDINYSVKPLSTLSLDGELIGYEMSYDPEFEAYKLYDLIVNRDELIYYLKKTKEVLEYFTSMGIIYADFYSRNVLFNKKTGEIMLCDMDNIQIDDLKIDLLPYDLHEYEKQRGLDDGVHPFMHNKMVLQSFSMDEYFIDYFRFKKNFKNGSIEIIDSMLRPEKFGNEYLVEYIKKLNR